MTKSIIADKSLAFAIKIVHLSQRLVKEDKEFVLSKQILRSGTSIGANVREAEHAQSKADFLHKMNISLKEANETLYWLILLENGKYLTKSNFKTLYNEAEVLVKMLAAIVKTTKKNLNR